jgi:hypothetical protein
MPSDFVIAICQLHSRQVHIVWLLYARLHTFQADRRKTVYLDLQNGPCFDNNGYLDNMRMPSGSKIQIATTMKLPDCWL